MVLPPHRISGLALRSIARAAHNKVGSRAVYEVLRAELNLSALAALPDAYRGDAVGKAPAQQARPPRAAHDARLPPPTDGGWAATSEGFVAAYRSRKVTPSEVVSQALAGARELAARTPSVGPILEYADTEAIKEAEGSTERYRQGAPRGALDGVPFVVKEEAGVRGFAMQGGTTFLDDAPRTKDATCVERLRAAGAIVLGTTPMTEYGMSPVGFNSRRKMPRNPHDTRRAAGGSSTGSAVAVATGLVPFAVGADGGGSIRIPAAMTGIFGLKATWGRVSRYGGLYNGSVEHIGPLASSTLDLARCLEIVGPPDPLDPLTADAPKIDRGAAVRALGRGVKGLRIGIPETEWAHAHPDIAKACHSAARALEKEGAVLVPVESALTPYASSIGVIIMGIDACAHLQTAWRQHRDDFGSDLQLTLSALGHLSAIDYVDAQRLRSGLRAEMAKILKEVDLVAFPTTASTAISVSDGDWESGFLDARAIDNMCRFCFLANLTGLPASSAPIGKDRDGLPIGFQLVGDAWDEATVLAATAHLERVGVARVERPGIAVDIRTN